MYIYGSVRLTSLTKTTPNQIWARRSKKLGEIRVPVPARTGFGHAFPLCEFPVSGEVGGGGEIFLKGSRKIFNCLLFALKGLHVFFPVAILAQIFSNLWAYGAKTCSPDPSPK